ncbi:MAG: hypothetical protein EAZ95_07990 [Bacteroidetes bacterium]|nr:MAG: hypothetical protein EAZ95_07990 [Bacteroidota bacterium]
MNWETIFEKTSEVIVGKAAEIGIDKQNLLNKLLKGLGILKDKKQKILVLGCAGVGKTHFIKSLFDADANLTSYLPTDFTEEYSLIIDKMPITFVDTAGQRERKKTRKKTLMSEAGNIVGIINVVSYGYHEVEVHESEPTFENGKVHEGFLNDTLLKELVYLKEWVQFTQFTNAKWVITLVNKMDIWKPDSKKIQKYYSSPNGTYKKEIALWVGDDFDEHFVIPYSAALARYYGVIQAQITPAEQNELQILFLDKLVKLLTQDFSKP